MWEQEDKGEEVVSIAMQVESSTYVPRYSGGELLGTPEGAAWLHVQ